MAYGTLNGAVECRRDRARGNERVRERSDEILPLAGWVLTFFGDAETARLPTPSLFTVISGQPFVL
jgi:hypothetical protein